MIRRAASSGAWTLTDDDIGHLNDVLAMSGVPGMTIAIVEDGEIRQSIALGLRNIARNAPMAPDTVTAAASLGKPLFAAIALMLASEGRIDLDKPLAEQAELQLPSDNAARRVTARHVLSHSTGFPNWRRRAEPLASAFEPGARFGYSGEGFYLLQDLAEQRTGMSVEQLMRTRLFSPLGMSRTATVWQERFADNFATGYSPDRSAGSTPEDDAGRFAPAVREIGRSLDAWHVADALRAVSIARPAGPAIPLYALPNIAGSILTTAPDYARFLLGAVMRTPNGMDVRLHAQMLTPQTTINDRLSWGLGWGLERSGAGTYAWHWGDNGIYKNFVLVDLARARGVAVFTNSNLGFKAYDRAVRAASHRDAGGLTFWMVG
jgi:CubicO group peptidase (beta-lactamase class C family)